MKITYNIFTKKWKNYINEELKKHVIASIGIDGLADDPILFRAQKDKKQMGYLVVQIFFGQLHIKYMLVEKNYRNKGYGQALVQHAIAYGKDKGCKFAFVETMSFQAPKFYQKLGFQIELERNGYTENSSYYYLRRDL